MSLISFAPENNAKIWLQQSVHTFFSQVNWDDHAPEIQEIRQVLSVPSLEPISLTMSVSQFFAAINWEGAAIATSVIPTESLSPEVSSDTLTLDDFFSLF